MQVRKGSSYMLCNTPFRFDKGPSSSPVLLENINCTLRNGYHICSHNGFGNTSCPHDKDIAISCQAGTFRASLSLLSCLPPLSHHWIHATYSIYLLCTDGAIRLVENGSSIAGGSRGHLEIYIGGRWGAVCLSDGFSQMAADIVCRQLGYERALKYGRANDLGLE